MRHIFSTHKFIMMGIVAAFTCGPLCGMASNTKSKHALFQFNKGQVAQALDPVLDIEAYLKHRSAPATITVLREEAPQLLSHINLQTDIQKHHLLDEPDKPMWLGYPIAFLVGFCCGLLGVAAVFLLSDGNKSKVKASIIGAVTYYAACLMYYFFMLTSNGTLPRWIL